MNGYSIHEVAELSGLSVRTLQYYDERGLLKVRRQANNYRVYSAEELDRLQQILLYREAGVPLRKIKEILDDPAFDVETSLENHLESLLAQKSRLDALIENVKKTLAARQKEEKMNDKEKFSAFKKELVDENERKYGHEIREKYGDGTIDASNAKLMGLSEAEYRRVEELSEKVLEVLARAKRDGDPAGALAQEACETHKQWLISVWPEGTYSKDAHLGLSEMYVCDERFRSYYDKEEPGAAEFLREALKIYYKA